MNKPAYDLVIVGGGIAGATLACALGESPLRLAVIEAKAPAAGWPEDSVDLRVSAITRASMRIFAALGVWEGIVRERVSPFREMHVWDATGPGAIHFDSAEIGEPTLGYIIENRVIQAALLERLRGFTNIDRVYSTRIEAMQLGPEQANLQTDNGRRIETRLVVGADGPDSSIRQLAGIATHGWDYRQTAVVATVRTANSHRETAWQRFLPGGPLAFLPLSNGMSSIVWSVPSGEAERLLALDEPAFVARLQQALGETQGPAGAGLGEIQSAGPRAGFPLRLTHADNYVKPRLALIGDAAHTIHPLAGQGVNLGLSDAVALAEVLLDAWGKDPGALGVLRRYERWRKGDNFAMMAALEGIKRLFGSRLPPVRWIRNLGFNLTDAAIPIKNSIMRRAMGLTGDLPKLARGMPLNGHGEPR